MSPGITLRSKANKHGGGRSYQLGNCFIRVRFLLTSHTTSSLKTMSFSVFRTSLRSARANSLPLRRGAQQLPRAQFRATFNRNFSTPPPGPGAKSSNTILYLGLGAAAAGGLAYYFYNTESGKEAGTAIRSGAQAGKVAANFVPTKDDYTKVGCPVLLKNCAFILFDAISGL